MVFSSCPCKQLTISLNEIISQGLYFLKGKLCFLLYKNKVCIKYGNKYKRRMRNPP